jgi:hypothetical protein
MRGSGSVSKRHGLESGHSNPLAYFSLNKIIKLRQSLGREDFSQISAEMPVIFYSLVFAGKPQLFFMDRGLSWHGLELIRINDTFRSIFLQKKQAEANNTSNSCVTNSPHEETNFVAQPLLADD